MLSLAFGYTIIEERRERMAENLSQEQVEDEIWLNFFNNFLFEKGLITEKERNKMTALIAQDIRKPSRKRKDDYLKMDFQK